MICGVVAASISGCDVCTACRVVCDCMNLYMLRAVPLPIIRSSFTVHLALVYVIQYEDNFRTGAYAPARKLSSNLYDINLFQCQVYSE